MLTLKFSRSVITNANTHRAAERLQPCFLTPAKLVVTESCGPPDAHVEGSGWDASKTRHQLRGEVEAYVGGFREVNGC